MTLDNYCSFVRSSRRPRPRSGTLGAQTFSAYLTYDRPAESAAIPWATLAYVMHFLFHFMLKSYWNFQSIDDEGGGSFYDNAFERRLI